MSHLKANEAEKTLVDALLLKANELSKYSKSKAESWVAASDKFDDHKFQSLSHIDDEIQLPKPIIGHLGIGAIKKAEESKVYNNESDDRVSLKKLAGLNNLKRVSSPYSTAASKETINKLKKEKLSDSRNENDDGDDDLANSKISSLSKKSQTNAKLKKRTFR